MLCHGFCLVHYVHAKTRANDAFQVKPMLGGRAFAARGGRENG